MTLPRLRLGRVLEITLTTEQLAALAATAQIHQAVRRTTSSVLDAANA